MNSSDGSPILIDGLHFSHGNPKVSCAEFMSPKEGYPDEFTRFDPSSPGLG
jgi:hypothetical protein